MLSLSNKLRSSALVLMVGLGSSYGCGGDDGSPTPDPTSNDASTPSKPDAKAVADTGAKPPRDAGPPSPSGNAKLDGLAGRYLMRFDTFGTGTTGISPVVVSIRSRVSLLFVTELVVDGDHLTASERMCNQVATQQCLDSKGKTTGTLTCRTATTEVNQAVVDNFFHKTQFEREYTLEADGTITGEYAATELGYDGDGPLPTSGSDKVVWDVLPNQAPREGILTTLNVTNVANFGTNLKCDVYGTEKLVTTFSGMLGGTESAPLFPTMKLDFKTPDTSAARLGSTDMACDAAGDSPNDKAVVRLLRIGDASGDLDCPADSEFDDKLPPDPVVDP